MVRKSRDRVRRTARGLVALLLLLPAFLHAQVDVELSTRRLAVGERFTYEIRIDYEEPEDVSVPDVSFPGFRLVDGPSLRPVIRTTGSERTRIVEVRLAFEAVRAGRYVLEPIRLSVAGQQFETPARLVEVGERGARENVPFLARWVVPRAPLVVGEAAAVTLEIYNSREFVYPSAITVSTPENAIFEEVQGLGENAQRIVDGVTLYEIPVAVFMVTPSAGENLRLESAVVEWEELSATAPASDIPVIEAPDEIAASGAVGEFVISAELSATSISQAETVELGVRLSGTGNLHFLQMPEVTLDGFVIDDELRDERLAPAISGYTGYIEETLILRPDGAGTGRVAVEPFTYLDTGRNRVVTSRLPEFDLAVTPVKEPDLGESTDLSFSLLNAEEISSIEPRDWYRRAESYGLFAPGILAFIVLRLWKRKSAKGAIVALVALMLLGAAATDLPWADINRGLDTYEAGNFRASLHSFERAARHSPSSPGIQHNLSVLYFQRGDIGRSVFAAREAVRLNPSAGLLRNTLALVEGAAGLDSSVPGRHLVHPDLVFGALLVATNMLLVLLALRTGGLRPRRTALIAIGRILSMVVVIGLTVGLVVAVRTHSHQVGVVLDDLSLQRIPSETAESWLELPAGTAVEVVAEEGGFVLVRTDLGLEGWVPLERLLWRDNPALDILRYRAFAL